MLVAKLIL